MSVVTSCHHGHTISSWREARKVVRTFYPSSPVVAWPCSQRWPPSLSLSPSLHELGQSWTQSPSKGSHLGASGSDDWLVWTLIASCFISWGKGRIETISERLFSLSLSNSQQTVFKSGVNGPSWPEGITLSNNGRHQGRDPQLTLHSMWQLPLQMLKSGNWAPWVDKYPFEISCSRLWGENQRVGDPMPVLLLLLLLEILWCFCVRKFSILDGSWDWRRHVSKVSF